MRVIEPNEWYQVAGDVSPADYGGTLAKTDGITVDLWRIQNVEDHIGSREAEQVGKPFWVSTCSINIDDLLDSDVYADALVSHGVAEDEYHEMDALQRAEIVADYGGHYEHHEAVWGEDATPEGTPIHWYSEGDETEAFRDADEQFRAWVLGEEE